MSTFVIAVFAVFNFIFVSFVFLYVPEGSKQFLANMQWAWKVLTGKTAITTLIRFYFFLVLIGVLAWSSAWGLAHTFPDAKSALMFYGLFFGSGVMVAGTSVFWFPVLIKILQFMSRLFRFDS